MPFLRRGRLSALSVILLSAVIALSVFAFSASSASTADDCHFFPETSFNVCGRFLTYWRTNGALAQQGFPISVVFEERNADPPAGDGKIHRVQYFQRARFEEHLENQPPYDVLLGLLGTEQVKAKYNGNPPGIPSPGSSLKDCYGSIASIAAGGYLVCGHFLEYWKANGGLAQQGYPISFPFEELNAPPPAGDGKIHLVQYFQRARFEEHLENAPPYDVLLGLLGTEQYNAKYGTQAPPSQPPSQAATCDNTSAGTNGAYSFLKCGPAGMEVVAVAPLQANEVVAVTMVRPNGTSVQFTDKKAQGDGTVGQGVVTYPNTTLGRYTIKFKGKTSGKEAEANFFLQPAVSAPTIIISPNPARVDQFIAFVMVGFAPETPLRVNIRNPEAKDANANTLFDTTQGGGLTLGFIASKSFPSDLVKPGNWFISAVDTKNEKVYATANFTLTK